jgi:hypothetical protein
MTTFGGDDEFPELVLFACEGCNKCYVLEVGQIPKAECPTGSHGYMAVVKSGSKYVNFVTCANLACKRVLDLSLHFGADNKCEVCNKKSGTPLGDLVDDYGVVDADAEIAKLKYEVQVEEKGSRAARRLEDAISKTEGFTTSHHKGTSGHHRPGQTAIHDRGDREDAQKRKQKIEDLQRLVDELENSPNYDEKKHRKLIERAKSLM